jgi:hypothetical protein
MASKPKRGPAAATDTVDLVKAYAKQELLAPVQGMGRGVGYGVAGALCLGIGFVLLAMALLRALQTETGDALDGNWTWVPYAVVLVVLVAVVAIAVSRIKRTPYHRKDGSR